MCGSVFLLIGCGAAAQAGVGSSTPAPPTVTPIPPTPTPMPTRVPIVAASDDFQYHIIAGSMYPSLGSGTNEKDAGDGKAWLVSIVEIRNPTSSYKARVGGNVDDYVLVDGKDKSREDSEAEDLAKGQFGVEKLGTVLGTGFDAGQTKPVVFVYKVPSGNHSYEESFQKSTQLVNLAIYLQDKQMTAANYREAAPGATATAGAIAAATTAPIATMTAAPLATAQAQATAKANATSAANAPLAIKHLGAGNTLLQAGNLTGALNEYATAQALSPNRADVQSAVGTVQARLAQATAQAKSKAIADHLGAAHSFEQAANYDAAIKEYDAALALDPKNSDATQGRAKLIATATAIAMHRDATATAQAQVQAATATAQADAAAAKATAQAQAQATAQVQALVSNPPPGTYKAQDSGVGVAAWDFRYVQKFGVFEASPGSRYIACAVEVAGADNISVNPLYFTLVLSDGTSYPVDNGMFAYWSTPLNATEVPAGGHAEGGILFLVKSGVAPKQLIYKPLQLLNFTNVVVDLTKPTK